jgi:predicted peptidase
MENSFKNNSANYNVEIGMINNDQNYTKTNDNKYTLYISEQALNKKDKHNGVFLFLHGAGEKKENMEQ